MTVKKKTFLFDAMKLNADLFRMPDDGRKWRYDAERRKTLFINLGAFADKTGHGACPSVKTLCERTGHTRSAEWRYLADLLLAGWIVNRGKSRFQGTTTWDLNLTPMPIVSEKPKDPKPPAPSVPDKPPTVPDSPPAIIPDSDTTVPDSQSKSPTLEPTVPDSVPKTSNVGHELSFELPTGTVKDICPPTNQTDGWTAGWSEDSDDYETFKDCGQVDAWTVVSVVYRKWRDVFLMQKNRKVFPSALSRHGVPELESVIALHGITKEETATAFGTWILSTFADAVGTDHEITSPVLLFARSLHGLVISERDEERRWKEKEAERAGPVV